jgi:hypothetical protein
VYGHVGYKFGGMRLDGEGSSGAMDPMRPWAERALTVDLFAYRSASRYHMSGTAADGSMLGPTPVDDETITFGGNVRAQWDSLELNTGVYTEQHDRGTYDFVAGTGINVDALAQYDELTYVVFPWLVPGVRVDYLRLSPKGGTTVDDLRITPGFAALVRPNLKATLIAQIEKASGAPAAGWAASGAGFFSAVTNTEIELIQLGMAYAF